MPTSQSDVRVVTGQTTNATPLTILTYAHLDAACMASEAVVQARDAAGNVKTWKLALVTKRTAGGNTAAVGSLQNLMTAQGDSALSSAAATISASGTNVVVQVTGIAATTINWRVVYTCEIHQP